MYELWCPTSRYNGDITRKDNCKCQHENEDQSMTIEIDCLKTHVIVVYVNADVHFGNRLKVLKPFARFWLNKE